MMEGYEVVGREEIVLTDSPTMENPDGSRPPSHPEVMNATSGGSVGAPPPIPATPDVTLVTMQSMLEQQSRMLSTFMQQQSSINQTLMTALSTGTLSMERASTLTAPSTSRDQGRVSDNRSVNESSPNQTPSFTPDNSPDEWKQVAMLLANKPPPTTLEKPTFRCRKGKHPVVFLNHFERYFKSLRVPESEKLELVKECLQGSASEWAETVQSSWLSYQDFERDFFKLFWSEDRQFAERVRLGNLKFLSERSLSMTDYFLRQVSAYRLFDPPVSEPVILSEVMRQYPAHIQSLWSVVPNRSIVSAIEFFERQEIITSKRPRLETSLNQPHVAVIDVSVPPPRISTRHCNCQHLNNSSEN